MTSAKLRDLLEKGLIQEEQFNNIEPIISRKVLSVFYELRTLLYLGVMLFTTGVGILIYQNIGELGHILAIIALSALSVLAISYCFIKGKQFSVSKVESPSHYFDYVLLLGCLLLVSVLGYLEFQFGFLERYGRISSLITSVLFFFFAYRFDHLGVLSLAITSLASFFGIVVSINDLSSYDQLYDVGLVYSLLIGIPAIVLERKQIKGHFTFTYLNFAAIIFFCSALAGLFGRGEYNMIYLLVLFVGVGVGIFLSNQRKAFIFLLYSAVAGYIGVTYALIDVIEFEIGFWFFYMILSCGGIIALIVRYRNFLKRKE